MINISVIIPCYNVESYLHRCINSVINQTLKNIEIIIIDDKSTDNTLNILHEFAPKDNRIHLICLEKNSGVAHARNTGLTIAKGQYVSFIDPDDYIDLDFLENLYNQGIKTRADIIKGFASSVKEISSTILINKLYFYAQWWSAIYKLELLEKNKIRFPEDVFCGQDFVFQRHACLLANSVSVVTLESYYHYCKREGSLDSAYFPYNKVKSQMLARKYIVELANMFCSNDTDYKIIIARLFSEIEWLWNKTNDYQSRLTICEKYINIYQLLKFDLLKDVYPILDYYMKQGNALNLYEHLVNLNDRSIYKLERWV